MLLVVLWLMASSTQGDPQYGIDKLKEAAQLDNTNPEIDIQSWYLLSETGKRKRRCSR